jgi:hypothetical protein
VCSAESSQTSSSWRCQYGGITVGGSPYVRRSRSTQASRSVHSAIASSAANRFQFDRTQRLLVAEVGGPDLLLGIAVLRDAALEVRLQQGLLAVVGVGAHGLRQSEADGLGRFVDHRQLVVRRVGLLGGGAVDDVAGPRAIVPDAPGDELLTDLAATAGALLLVLVDVARGNDPVAGLEPRVGPLGGAVEHHQSQ